MTSTVDRAGFPSVAAGPPACSGLHDATDPEIVREIVLPDADAHRATLVEKLSDEFAELPGDVIERVTAAARHALERSHQLPTSEAIEQLARDRLRSKLAATRFDRNQA